MDMKHAIILAAWVSLPLFGGQPAAIAPAPVPAPQAPQTASPWEMELGATYSWAVPDTYRDWASCQEVKSIGGDITAVYRVSEHSALTLRFGYSWGGNKWADSLELSALQDGPLANFRPTSPFGPSLIDKYKQEIMKIYESLKRKNRHPSPTALQTTEAMIPAEDLGEMDERVDFWSRARVHTFSFMPGYRCTHALTPQLSVYGGVNAGIANASNKLNMYIEHEHLLSAHDSAWGFAYSAELGFCYAVAPAVNLFAAYQFCGNTAKCKPHCEFGKVTANRLHYHGVRAGVGFRF